MDETLTRIWTDLVGRLTGPLTLRLFMQPVMSSLFAVRDGWKDAKAGRPPYLWALLTHPHERRPLLTDGLKSVGKIFAFAIILDVIYQLIVFRWIYPVEILDVGILLAVIPYALLRGPINRIARSSTAP